MHSSALVLVILYRLEKQLLAYIHQRRRIDNRVPVHLLVIYQLKQFVVDSFEIPLRISDKPNLLFALNLEVYLEFKPELSPGRDCALAIVYSVLFAHLGGVFHVRGLRISILLNRLEQLPLQLHARNWSARTLEVVEQI